MDKIYTKVSNYIETICDDNFKLLLLQPFKLCTLYNNDNETILFSEWRGKNMGNWYKYSNDDNITLEFYPDYYIIKKHKEIDIKLLKLPITLNDFINDMNKYGIKLYWSDYITNNYEPKEYMEKNNIENYFTDLLKKINKSHELILQ